jgi:hypothetical protein
MKSTPERVTLTTGFLGDEIEDLIVSHGCTIWTISDAFGISKKQVKKLVDGRDVFERRYNVEMWTSILRASEAINSGVLPADFGTRKPHTGDLYPELFELLEEIFIDDCVRQTILSQTFNVTKSYIRNRFSKYRLSEVQRLKRGYDAVTKYVLMVRAGFLPDRDGILTNRRYELPEFISKRAAEITNRDEGF